MLQWNKSSLGQTPAEILRAKLPACYSQEFDECVLEASNARKENRPPKPSAYCDKYYPIISGTTNEIWDEAMKSVPYCPGPGASAKRDTSGIWPALAAVGVMGGVLAIVVNAAGARF
jgi:hypothetical protein